ncbi:MAG: type II toxin-antitoxin system HipA family toxin, partial [Deltaproteobacteria bacterium]|nr:type II toxin-antitoxin system HipA family toxin [Deltaproteobacteria bacterium]
MTLNGKQDNFTREDFYSFRKLSTLFTKRKIDRVIEETTEHFSTWNSLATEYGVPQALLKLIDSNLRLTI